MRIRGGIVSDLHFVTPPRDGLSWHNPFDVRGVPKRVRRAVRLFREAECDVLVCVGDLTHYGDESSLKVLVDLWKAEWGGALLVVPGNHDDPRLLEQIGADGFAGRPEGLLPLESVLLERGPPRRGHLKSASAEEAAPVRVIVSHYPLLSRRDHLERSGFAYAGDLANREQVANDLLGTASPAIVICGHLHARDSVSCHSMLQLAVGSVVEPPFECAVIDVDAREHGRLLVERSSVVLKAAMPGQRLPVFSAASERWKYTAGNWRLASDDAHI